MELPPAALLEHETNVFLFDLLTPGLLEQMGSLKPLGIAEGDDIRARIESLSLRQFLWLITHTYAMAVRYDPVQIVVGYGTFSHSILTPDDR